MLRTGQTFAGLRIVGSLGVGPAGEIYLVKPPQGAQEDILLLLPESRSGDPAYRQAFFTAAAQASSLEHSAVVAIRGYGEDQGRLWIATEYLPAPTLEAVVRQSGPLSARDAATAVTTVAGALDHARSRGSARASVAPSDVFVVDGPNGRSYRVTGFGIPEAGGPAGQRADQAALGDLAFFLISGGASIGQRVTTLRPELSPEVDEVLARVRRQAGDRYESCGDFAAALATALLGDEGTTLAETLNEPTRTGPTGVVGGPTVPAATMPGATPAATTPITPDQGASGQALPGQGVPGAGGGVPPVAPPGAAAPGQGATMPAYAAYPAVGAPPPGYGPAGPAGPVPPGGPIPPGYPGGPTGGGTGGSRGNRTALLIAGGVLVALIVVVGVVLALVLPGGGDDETTTASSSSSTTPTTSSTSPSSSAATNPAVVGGVPTACVAGSPTRRSTAPNLEAGPIRIPSAALPAGWSPDPGGQMPFLVRSDGIVVSRPAGQNWQAQLLVGTLPADFTGDLRAIGRKFIECLPDMPGYQNTNPRAPVIDSEREDHPTDSDMRVLIFRGKVPVSRGSITSDDFTLLIADTTPRSISLGYSANTDSLSRGEVDKAIGRTQVKTN